MNLILPNGDKVFLDKSLEYSERVKVVESITATWETHFRKNWYMNKTKVCLDVLSTYLVVTKEDEDKNKQDKYVMSATKVRKMTKGDSRKTNFSDLSYEEQFLLGFAEAFESDGY